MSDWGFGSLAASKMCLIDLSHLTGAYEKSPISRRCFNFAKHLFEASMDNFPDIFHCAQGPAWSTEPVLDSMTLDCEIYSSASFVSHWWMKCHLNGINKFQDQERLSVLMSPGMSCGFVVAVSASNSPSVSFTNPVRGWTGCILLETICLCVCIWCFFNCGVHVLFCR